jgi:hypothetical protein
VKIRHVMSVKVRLLMHISNFLLFCGLAILAAYYLSLVEYLYGLRAQLPPPMGVTLSWDQQITTSLPFILCSPMVPVLGIIWAWKQKHHPRQNMLILSGSILLTIFLVLFAINSEPLEGYFGCC